MASRLPQPPRPRRPRLANALLVGTPASLVLWLALFVAARTLF